MSSMSPRPGTSIAYAYDPEAAGGPIGKNRGAKTLGRRLFAGRRARILLAVTGCTVLFFYFNSPSTFSSSVYSSSRGRGDTRVPGVTGIWDQDEEEVEPDGWGWGFGPFKRPPSKDTHVGSKAATHKPSDYIAPAHPDLSLLPGADELFDDFRIPSSFRPPLDHPFPDTRLREISSPEAMQLPIKVGSARLADDSFHKTWQAPEQWDGPKGDIRPVQWSGFAGGRDHWENKNEMKTREKRREAVKRAFGYAWQAYKDHAWGYDEVKPVSGRSSDPFNNWGASIIDTLDTLLVMELSDEYNLCRPHVNQVNFHWIGGRDWSTSFTSEPPPTDDDETPSETWTVPRDPSTGLPVFETSIRYLGGLLGAYDLSGDQLLLDRAIELANILSRAFNTTSGIPAGRIDPGANPAVYHLGQVSIAEAGSMSLEFIRLSQITGDRSYFDLVQRAMDFLDLHIIPRSTQNPLIPLWFFPDASTTGGIGGAFAFGGLADSYYEYLIKTYKLLGASPVADQWKRVYEASIDKAKELLYVDIDFIPDVPILAIGKFEGNRLIHEIEHLTCFAGAMLGLGAKLLDRPGDMVDADKVTSSCYWLSAGTPTGLQPEVVEFYTPIEVEGHAATAWETITLDGHVKRPAEITPDNTHEDHNGVLRWNIDGEIVYQQDGARDTSQETYVRKLKGRPPGAKKVVGRGINRPETIESIFYMYRLTGDRKWQEKGWKMFVSWVTTAKTAAGVSSIEDVTKDLDKIRFGDNMESFAFAETFKYHFLLQSEPDVLSLDDYVLNTEAHPLLVNPDHRPGHSRLWHPPANRNDNLGIRGQGTDAQKWTRLAVLQRSSGGPRVDTGAGRGMGGGGGDPNHRPKPPGF